MTIKPGTTPPGHHPGGMLSGLRKSLADDRSSAGADAPETPVHAKEDTSARRVAASADEERLVRRLSLSHMSDWPDAIPVRAACSVASPGSESS